MLLEDIILYANIQKWRNPRAVFFLNISGVEALLLLDVPPQKIKTFICLWAFSIMQANSMSFNGDFIAAVIML